MPPHRDRPLLLLGGVTEFRLDVEPAVELAEDEGPLEWAPVPALVVLGARQEPEAELALLVLPLVVAPESEQLADEMADEVELLGDTLQGGGVASPPTSCGLLSALPSFCLFSPRWPAWFACFSSPPASVWLCFWCCGSLVRSIRGLVE